MAKTTTTRRKRLQATRTSALRKPDSRHPRSSPDCYAAHLDQREIQKRAVAMFKHALARAIHGVTNHLAAINVHLEKGVADMNTKQCDCLDECGRGCQEAQEGGAA